VSRNIAEARRLLSERRRTEDRREVFNPTEASGKAMTGCE